MIPPSASIRLTIIVPLSAARRSVKILETAKRACPGGLPAYALLKIRLRSALKSVPHCGLSSIAKAALTCEYDARRANLVMEPIL